MVTGLISAEVYRAVWLGAHFTKNCTFRP